MDENDIMKLDINNENSGEYEIEAIWDSAIYTRESVGYLSGLYYLVF